jgi:glutaminyl-tRNA synthetase
VDPERSLDFVRAKVEEDLRTGKHGGRVVTRFPPEPNGHLHIGHAKAICLDFGIAEEYGGVCHLRFDDTNPEKEETEYVEGIQEDVRWLGFDWGEHLYFASDYFERMYELAVQLIRDGKAYVDSASEEEIRALRGTVTEPGTPSPSRERGVAENLDLFRRMRAGEFADGEHVLRARIDLASANMKMRDPLLYRIRHADHHRTGDAWCLYPMYDYAHPLEDCLEDVTHSLCTLEFENNREIYDWVRDECAVDTHPEQTEFARLELSYTVLSKRRLLQLVAEDRVRGWDDPRMPTLAGLRRRGVPPEAIRAFCDRVGVAKANSLVDVALLEHHIRDELNHRVPRVMCVQDPLKIVIENYPEGPDEVLEAPLYPHDVPLQGQREVPFGRELYIERKDFREQPPKGFHRLSPGREVRLRYAYLVTCTGVVRDDAGRVIQVNCRYDPESRGGNPPDGRKVRGTLHWVSARGSLPCELRVYDRLFRSERPGSETGDPLDDLNPESLSVVGGARIEPSVADDPPGSRYQFERLGYFCSDALDSSKAGLVFNRTVPLRDSWAKASSREEAPQPAPRRTGSRSPDEAAAAPPTAAPAARGLSTEQRAVADRYVAELGVNAELAAILVSDPDLLALYDDTVAAGADPGDAAGWLANELLRAAAGAPVPGLGVDGAQMASLLALIRGGEITGKIGKQVLAFLLRDGGDPRDIVEREGLLQISDREALAQVVDQVLDGLPDKVAAYRAGNARLIGLFVGQVMRATDGRANPQAVHELLRERLAGRR